MSTKNYDIVILGGGPGGYTAAIRAAQLGKSVALVEKDKLGGTCLHKGCIPSKSYLQSAKMFHAMKHAESYGIDSEAISLNFEKVRIRKDNVVSQLHQGVNYLIEKNKIDLYRFPGRVIGPSIFSPRSGAVALDTEEEVPTLVPKHLIIATGSRPSELPGLQPDGKQILNSDQALEMDRLPQSVLIVGGGVIGVEWASLLSDFGVKVTLVETMPRLLGQEDEDLSKQLERNMRERGIEIHTSTHLKIDTFIKDEEGVRLEATYEDDTILLQAEAVLTCVGRTPNTEQLGLENTDVDVRENGIRVNANYQTSESHIYAIGDVIGGQQLAHVAAREGVLAVEHAVGMQPDPLLAERIPRCVYTRPEIAAIGLSEAEAKLRGKEVKVAVVPFQAIGKAWVQDEPEGFVKVIADKDTDDLLGIHIIGPQATEMISAAAIAQILDATPWEVSQTIFAHPTLSEAIGEVMLAVQGRAIGI